MIRQKKYLRKYHKCFFYMKPHSVCSQISSPSLFSLVDKENVTSIEKRIVQNNTIWFLALNHYQRHYRYHRCQHHHDHLLHNLQRCCCFCHHLYHDHIHLYQLLRHHRSHYHNYHRHHSQHFQQLGHQVFTVSNTWLWHIYYPSCCSDVRWKALESSLSSYLTGIFFSQIICLLSTNAVLLSFLRLLSRALE